MIFFSEEAVIPFIKRGVTMKRPADRPRIILFQIVVLFFWFSQYAYVPNLTAYAREMGVSLTVIGMISGAYGLGQTVLRVPLGLLSDRIGKRKIIVSAGFLMAFLAAMLFLLFDSPAMMVAARTVSGFASATWVVSTVLYSAYFKESESPAAMNRLNMFNYGGQVLSMAISGALLLAFSGYKVMFIVAAAGALIGFVVSLFATEVDPENRKKADLRSFLGIASDQRLLLLAFSMMLLQVFLQSTISGFTPILAQDLGADSLARSILGIINLVFAIIGSLVITLKKVRKIREDVHIAVTAIGFSVSAILFPFAGNLLQLYLIQALAGFCQGAMLAYMMGLAVRHFPGEKRATAMGVFQTLYGLGMLVGPLITGGIGDHFGLKISYFVLALLSLFIIPLVVLWRKIDQKAQRQHSES